MDGRVVRISRPARPKLKVKERGRGPARRRCDGKAKLDTPGLGMGPLWDGMVMNPEVRVRGLGTHPRAERPKMVLRRVRDLPPVPGRRWLSRQPDTITGSRPT